MAVEEWYITGPNSYVLQAELQVMNSDLIPAHGSSVERAHDRWADLKINVLIWDTLCNLTAEVTGAPPFFLHLC